MAGRYHVTPVLSETLLNLEMQVPFFFTNPHSDSFYVSLNLVIVRPAVVYGVGATSGISKWEKTNVVHCQYEFVSNLCFGFM